MSNRGTDLVSILPGLILPYAGTSAPAIGSGWLACDGAAVSRSTYADLFTAIGTTYGAGNGSTTFNVPDFRGSSLIGVGQGASLSNRVIGASGGAETHTLAISEMPSHNHGLSGFKTNQPNNTNSGTSIATSGSGTASGNVDSQGGGAAHNNMPPFVAVHFVIKT